MKETLIKRNGIAEWAVTILLLLFGTATLAQPFVIPTGSMEDTLLVGDHLLVDKLAYAPAGPISKHLLPYQEPKHGDIIVFRYPADVSVTLVKRLIGMPGDRLRLPMVSFIEMESDSTSRMCTTNMHMTRLRQFPESVLPSSEGRGGAAGAAGDARAGCRGRGGGRSIANVFCDGG